MIAPQEDNDIKRTKKVAAVGPYRYKPDLVIAMNSIYIREIETDLRKLGLSPTMMPIEASEMSQVGAVA